MNLQSKIKTLLLAFQFSFSDILPSEWHEQNRVMKSDESAFSGKFSYSKTPFCREIIDCLHPGHPATVVVIMKSGQAGVTTGVVEGGIGWIISQNPGNILLLTGHAELAEESVLRVDKMIDGSGIRHLIRPSVLRKKNARTGDTNKSKEFPGGSLVSGSANNHKLLRQRSIQYGFIDDMDAAKSSDKDSGSTKSMIEQRFAAFASKMKLFYISTPELKHKSNIEPLYLLGDQRKFNIPCPECGEFITLEWMFEKESGSKEMVGITWQLDNKNELIPESVGYVCQECGEFFDDTTKDELLNFGKWVPTAAPKKMGHYSYHLNALYAPSGMFDWKHYVEQYLEANPPFQPRKEELHKTFVNLVLAETFEPSGDAVTANDVQKKVRNYSIGIIPEKVSERDGNGKIVLITCACDLNGTKDDARLDYEVLAWSESGSNYSIDHGSIGTFIPREGSKKYKVDREKWTYQHGKERNVWDKFDKVIQKIYDTDTGRQMKIMISGVDCGHYTAEAYGYLDITQSFVVGLKGKADDKYMPFGFDVPYFKPARERNKLYILEVGKIKDDLANKIKLTFDETMDSMQQPGSLNYPQPSAGKYQYDSYFRHYESEQRDIQGVDGENPSFIWRKKGGAMNHFWDVRVYNNALKEIIVSIFCKELKIKNYGWQDYVDIILQGYNSSKK